MGKRNIEKIGKKKIEKWEKDVLKKFIERNVKAAPDNMDEGIGTVYERIVIDEYLQKLTTKYNIKKVLESPADGVTGIPGINSLKFARLGCNVTLTNPSKLMLDNAKSVWKQNNLLKRVRFVKAEVDKLPFKDNTFDFVWNYCMFERFKYPEVLVNEMLRVSRDLILIMTQNKWNFGTLIHRLYHKIAKMEWDHGYTRFMTFKGILSVFNMLDIEVLEIGTIDTPPWMDTWDMPLRGEIKKFLKPFGAKWEWKIEDEKTTTADSDKNNKAGNGKLVSFLVWIEKNLPLWFSKLSTHHLYVLGRKKTNKKTTRKR